MRHLLVPVDFSEYALNAGKYAVRLASQLGAKITILHAYHIPVVDPMIPVDYLANMADDLQKETSRAVERVIEQLNAYALKKELTPVEITPFITMGLAVDEILEAVQKQHCDLIVMGRRHTEGMAKILLGSITATIVGNARVPVLVVPESVNPDTPLTNILYASNLDLDDQRVLSRLLPFTQATNAKLHCLHVNWQNDAENSSAMFSDLAKKYTSERAQGKIVFEKIVSEDVPDALLDYIASHQVSMVAMLTHKRPFFTRLFDKSLARTVALKTNVPVLVYHDGDKETFE